MDPFIKTITSHDPSIRNRAFEDICNALSTEALLASCEHLEKFRRETDNLYERVRATLFLYAAHYFHLVEAPSIPSAGHIPWAGVDHLLARRFEEAIGLFRKTIREKGANGAVLSALAEAYHHLTFQTLADQVRRSVRASRGNQWMFRFGHYADHPIKIKKELIERTSGTALFPILVEKTPVRLDLSHSGWSDIFFLGMDCPEGARVLNISVDLGVYKRDPTVNPPVATYLRVIPEPVIRLSSIDLACTKDITHLDDLFNFGNDYLSLLKAGLIASGVIPPSFEGTNAPIDEILKRVVGPGLGLELVTQVNDIPKGSRLAVSTNLLASIIALLMRATGQTERLTGNLSEPERRLVASRAILGEWLGGSGGGWQDSGGIWPGLKVITGATAREGDPEFGISKGRLLPNHRVLDEQSLHSEVTQRLRDAMILLHGGMAQDVGPILEMVTEKYLLRGEKESRARAELGAIFDQILAALAAGDIPALGRLTSRNFDGPLRAIIPAVTNRFTETLIARAKTSLARDFWGFLMLGGMSGGGMAMLVNPARKAGFRDEILEIMHRAKHELQDALPFAMQPVVYDFEINRHGTRAHLLNDPEAVMPMPYHALQVPEMVRKGSRRIPYLKRAELEMVTASKSPNADSFELLRSLVGSLFRVDDPASHTEREAWDAEALRIKHENGFDSAQHEQIRSDLKTGRIGLSKNRLPIETVVEDVRDDDVVELAGLGAEVEALGEAALREGRVAVLSLAGGVGSRWTSGAGVVKAANPFCEMAGRHRSFIEIHLAKTRRSSARFQTRIPHVISSSFLTHPAIEKHLARIDAETATPFPVRISQGRCISQRLIPMVRDLSFLWEETPQELLDEQKQKVREAVRKALIDWARSRGEGEDYTDNVALQRLHPPGHWYEFPNLLKNGVLAELLAAQPRLETLMLHNIDTLGADLDPRALGHHLRAAHDMTFEVVPRRIVDRGGGLARVNGKVRLLEGLAQPREEEELRLRYYNSMTTWVSIEALLERFGLSRGELTGAPEKIDQAVRRMAQRVPTYVTIKEVKRRWGHGQEDVYPVTQFEKLWSDMTGLVDVACGYLAVPRVRGQQLKDPAQLDGWIHDGSKAHVEGLCTF